MPDPTRWQARAEAVEEKCDHGPYKWGACVSCIASFAAEVARETVEQDIAETERWTGTEMPFALKNRLRHAALRSDAP